MRLLAGGVLFCNMCSKTIHQKRTGELGMSRAIDPQLANVACGTRFRPSGAFVLCSKGDTRSGRFFPTVMPQTSHAPLHLRRFRLASLPCRRPQRSVGQPRRRTSFVGRWYMVQTACQSAFRPRQMWNKTLVGAIISVDWGERRPISGQPNRQHLGRVDVAPPRAIVVMPRGRRRETTRKNSPAAAVATGI